MKLKILPRVPEVPGTFSQDLPVCSTCRHFLQELNARAAFQNPCPHNTRTLDAPGVPCKGWKQGKW